MKKFSEMKISRLSDVIRSVLIGLITFVMLFALLLYHLTLLRELLVCAYIAENYQPYGRELCGVGL